MDTRRSGAEGGKVGVMSLDGGLVRGIAGGWLCMRFGGLVVWWFGGLWFVVGCRRQRLEVRPGSVSIDFELDFRIEASPYIHQSILENQPPLARSLPTLPISIYATNPSPHFHPPTD